MIPIPSIFSIASWIIFYKATRFVSVGSIAAALAIPIFASIQAAITGKWDLPILTFCLVVCFLAIWKHRGNIKRLIKGEEARFQKKEVKKA